jgi:hypothetical protein
MKEFEPQKVRGWVARCSEEYNNDLYLFMDYNSEHPHRMATYWLPAFAWDSMKLPKDMFPDLKWEDEPVLVEITLTPVKE